MISHIASKTSLSAFFFLYHISLVQYCPSKREEKTILVCTFLSRHKKQKEEDIAICECEYDISQPESACGETCLNVLTSTECTPGFCPCGFYCKNQVDMFSLILSLSSVNSSILMFLCSFNFFLLLPMFGVAAYSHFYHIGQKCLGATFYTFNCQYASPYSVLWFLFLALLYIWLKVASPS